MLPSSSKSPHFIAPLITNNQTQKGSICEGQRERGRSLLIIIMNVITMDWNVFSAVLGAFSLSSPRSRPGQASPLSSPYSPLSALRSFLRVIMLRLRSQHKMDKIIIHFISGSRSFIYSATGSSNRCTWNWSGMVVVFKWASSASSYRALHRSPGLRTLILAQQESTMATTASSSRSVIQGGWTDGRTEEGTGEEELPCPQRCCAPVLAAVIRRAGRSSSSSLRWNNNHQSANCVCVWLIKSAYEFMFLTVIPPHPTAWQLHYAQCRRRMKTCIKHRFPWMAAVVATKCITNQSGCCPRRRSVRQKVRRSKGKSIKLRRILALRMRVKVLFYNFTQNWY